MKFREVNSVTMASSQGFQGCTVFVIQTGALLDGPPSGFCRVHAHESRFVCDDADSRTIVEDLPEEISQILLLMARFGGEARCDAIFDRQECKISVQVDHEQTRSNHEEVRGRIFAALNEKFPG